MISQLQNLVQSFGITTDTLILIGLGLGVLVAAFGLTGATAGPSAQIRRLKATSPLRVRNDDFDLVRGDDNDPNGLLKLFVPSSKQERTTIGKRMRQAGIQRKNAVLNYYTVRSVLGIGLPLAFLAARYAPPPVQALLGADKFFGTLLWSGTIQILAVLSLVGFYGPSIWLRQRIRSRQRAIWESFPNALDLLQISIEAGMGFDAAIVRVSHELAPVAPAIAEELMMLELEIQAGKDRSRAFNDMAERAGVQEVTAFANVVLQASQFGTSVASALSTYAEEMRTDRELRAQEKANRLPVQMSAIIALFMMPALLMICLAPMVIRWMRMFPS